MLDNYLAVRDALSLSREDIATLVRNSILGSFMDDAAKTRWVDGIDRLAG